MADPARLDDLRRRVDKDPSSIAFAQLAEEYRRAGLLEQAVEVCRAGLTIHGGYLSARVTLGRALIELNELDQAQAELEHVLHAAPENLAAIRGLAEIHHRRGDLEDALTQYRAALTIARNDPDLERTVEDLARQVAPPPRVEPANGLSFEQMHEELLAQATVFAAPVSDAAPRPQESAFAVPASDVALAWQGSDVEAASAEPPPADGASGFVAFDLPEVLRVDPEVIEETAPLVSVASVLPVPSRYNGPSEPANDRAERTIAVLGQWLDALNGSRTHSRP